MADCCGKCGKHFDDRRIMNCSICKTRYDLACANVSTPRYCLMSPNRKEKWRCESCWEKIRANKNNQESDRNESPTHDYITKRKKIVINVETKNSFSSLSGEDEDDEESEGNRSCPDLRINCSHQLENLKEKHDNLQNKLHSADVEIQNLIGENYTLKNRIKQLEQTVNNLKKICSSSSTQNKTTSTNKRSRKSLTKKKLNFCSEKEENQSFQDLNVSPTTSTVEINKEMTQISEKNTYRETENLSSQKQNPKKIESPGKLCIISSNSKNKILQSAENNLEHTEICHYLTPGAGVHKLLKGIERKLQDFTLKDYCIIFLGDYDFNKTENYQDIVNYIRDCLQKLQHTNIIICLPTYKYAKKIFNMRVELFNTLIYYDNLINEYAYILDCNKNLDYSPRMYTGQTGFLNNIGYRIIFSDLKILIADISENNQLNDITYQYDAENGNLMTQPVQQHMFEDEQKFFRDSM